MTVLGNGGGATQEVSGSELDKEPMDEMTVPARLPYRGIRNTSRQIYFEFLVIKTHPPYKFHKGFGFVIQFRVGILYAICQGVEF